MSTTTIEIACLFATVVGAIYAIVYQASLSAAIAATHKEVSRFHLFAARDRLVELVADGEMAEDGLAWQGAYGAVNNMLGMHQKLDLLDLSIRYARHLMAIERSHRVRVEHRRLLRSIDEAKESNPNFESVMRDIDLGFMHLVNDRTRLRHVLAILALYAYASASMSLRAMGRFVSRRKTRLAPAEDSDTARRAVANTPRTLVKSVLRPSYEEVSCFVQKYGGGPSHAAAG
jgi:hypothetical protein